MSRASRFALAAVLGVVAAYGLSAVLPAIPTAVQLIGWYAMMAWVCYGFACSCSTFCAYHSHYLDAAFGEVLYAAIPSAAACPTACGAFTSDTTSP